MQPEGAPSVPNVSSVLGVPTITGIGVVTGVIGVSGVMDMAASPVSAITVPIMEVKPLLLAETGTSRESALPSGRAEGTDDEDAAAE